MIVTDDEEKAYLARVHAIGDELGKRNGWMTEAARRLGVHKSTLTKVMNGQRRVTRRMLERESAQAMERDVDDVEIAAMAALTQIGADAWPRVRTWADDYFAAQRRRVVAL